MSINQNDSLAFKKFTNNRYKIVYTGDDGVGVLQMTPGLTPEELVGMMFPYLGSGFAVAVSAFPHQNSEYRDKIIEVLVCGETKQVPLYYSIKTGKLATSEDKIPDILAPTEG